MHVLFKSLVAGALLIGSGTVLAQDKSDRSPQAKLERALEGRVAGKPVDCLLQRDIRSTEIIDKTAILYRTRDNKLYVNTPRSGASMLNWGMILVTDTRTPQLCSINTVRLIDSASRIDRGFVGLGKFVPYTKAGDS